METIAKYAFAAIGTGLGTIIIVLLKRTLTRLTRVVDHFEETAIKADIAFTEVSERVPACATQYAVWHRNR
jgi:hypothetical protein